MIVDVLKEIALHSMESTLAIDILYGKVISLSPFSILIDQKLTLKKQHCTILNSALNGLQSGDTVLVFTIKNKFIVLGGV